MEYGKFILFGDNKKILSGIKNTLSACGHIFVGYSKETANILRYTRSTNPDLIIVEVCNNFRELKKNFEFIDEELKHILAASDLVVSRAGANVIFELLTLKKPNLLIPLSKKSSRGDQILNAESFKKNGYSAVLEEEELNEATLLEGIQNLYKDKMKYVQKMNSSPIKNGVEEIIKMIAIYSK